MPKIHADGVEIDATFSVERLASDIFSICFESRSGGTNTSNARNTQYRKGLDVLLQRLADIDATITSIALTSRQGDLTELKLSKHPYPWTMRNVGSIYDLNMELGRVQADTNRQPNAKGSGDRTKRIRIDCRVNRFVSFRQSCVGPI